MTRISAADNIIIDSEPTNWRMLVNTNFVDNIQGDGLLLEAAAGQPLRYTSIFARTRHLPKSGELPMGFIQRILLGWSEEDEAWHLGLVLEPPLSEKRGSRWCELARWPDPDRDLYGELATVAGENLARAIDRPFNRIRPKPKQEVAVEPKPLPPLPVDLQEWRFEQRTNGWFTFIRDGSWARERLRRVAWYTFWTIIYILLAVATLLSDIALPRPEFLPYLGLGVAVMLVGIILYNLYELRSKARHILVDPETHHIWGVTENVDSKPVWRKGREEIDSVYITELIKRKKGEPIIQYGEINLRLTSGKFYFLINQEEEVPLQGEMQRTDDIFPLKQNDVCTRLQASAFYIARALNVPAWHDYREK